MSGTLSLNLRIWRQVGPDGQGAYGSYRLEQISRDLSLLEALDVLNEQLIGAGERPVTFEHDCREGICGSCGFLVNGQAHGPQRGTATCQLHMRKFADGDEIVVEPWRARAFPILKDLMTDRMFPTTIDGLEKAMKVLTK